MNPSGGSYSDWGFPAVNYPSAATIYNVAVSGQTDYTFNIHIGYRDNSKLTEYVCGDGQIPGAPIQWSNDSQGH